METKRLLAVVLLLVSITGLAHSQDQTPPSENPDLSNTEVQYSSVLEKYQLSAEDLSRIQTPQQVGNRSPISRKVRKAIEADDTAAVLELIRNGDRFYLGNYWRNNSRYTAMEYAIKVGSRNTALMFLELGAEASPGGGAGEWVAISECINRDLPDVCRALAEAGFDPNTRDTWNGPTLNMSYLEQIARQGRADLFAALSMLDDPSEVETRMQEVAAGAQSRQRSGTSGSPQSGNPKRAQLSCHATELIELTDDQGAALLYLLEQKFQGQVGIKFCVEQITATQKIPLRGNTVIRYTAVFHYVNGYLTECLDGRPQDIFGALVVCSGLHGIKPQPPGTRLQYEGSDEI